MQPPPATPQPSPFNRRLLTVIFVGILLIIAIGAGGYLLGARQNQPVTTVPQTFPTQPPSSPTPDLTEDWEVFTSKHGFSIKYPPTWLYREVVDSTYGVDEVWFSSQAIGFPPPQTDARAPVVLKITTVDPSSDWSPEYFDDYQSIPCKTSTGLICKKVSGTNKESRIKETAVMFSINGRYILALPNDMRDSLAILDQMLSTFNFTN